MTSSFTAAGKKIAFADGKKSTVNIYGTDGILNAAETAITLNAATKAFSADSKLVTIDGSLTDGVAITGNTKANVFVGGNGAGDKVSLVSATITDAAVDKKGNTVLKVGRNSVTVKNTAEVTIVDEGGEKVFSSGVFYNPTKTTATLPVSFSAKGTTTLDAQIIDATLASKAVNLSGGDAANSIVGTVKNDTLSGGAGNDMLIGGKGNDALWGNAGADTFLYADGDGKDMIFGFDDTDMLQITGDFTATYTAKTNVLAFKVGSTAGAITLKDFTATNFNVNGELYQISGTTLAKK